MSVVSNRADAPGDVSLSEGVSADILRARRRRSIVINAIRILILIVIVGGWQFLATIKVIDPFFWGQPSGVWAQIVTWVTQGTAQGPLWEQIATTLEEAVLEGARATATARGTDRYEERSEGNGDWLRSAAEVPVPVRPPKVRMKRPWIIGAAD